ncbi:16773_t:CDS:2, partial [Cetraspora pellucida]
RYNWKGHISVLQNKPLNLYNIKHHENHDPDNVQKKPFRISSSIRKKITNRIASITFSMLITELINNSKTLSKTLNILSNQVQPISIQFVSNLKLIQNALKYDKMLHNLCISEFEKAEKTVISKQYSVKNTQDSKEQAVLLGIVSTIMLVFLTKYPDFLTLDSTSCHNSLNFSNTAFMVRSDEPCGQVVATFVSNKETIPVVDLMFESKLQAAIEITSLVVAETITSYFQKYWFGDWDTWIVSQFYINANIHYGAAKLDINKENSQYNTAKLDVNENNSQYNAAKLVNKENLINKSANESVTSSSLESYLCQKDANSKSIHLQNTILNMPYKTVKIVEIIGESRVIVDVTFNSAVAMVQTLGFLVVALDALSEGQIMLLKFQFLNNISYKLILGKKDTLYLTFTCPLDTSLTLMQSTFTHQNIYKQAIAFALSDSNSRIHLLLQVFDLIKQKK